MKTRMQLLGCQVVELLRGVYKRIATNSSATQQLSNWKHGGTLIEVMMACLVLTAIAFAGGAYVAQTSRTLAVSRERFQVLTTANSRMEEIRATKFNELSGLFPPGATQVSIVRNGAIWQSGAYDTVPLQNGDYIRVSTSLSKLDIIPSEAGNEGIWVDVQASCWAQGSGGEPLYQLSLNLICAP